MLDCRAPQEFQKDLQLQPVNETTATTGHRAYAAAPEVEEPQAKGLPTFASAANGLDDYPALEAGASTLLKPHCSRAATDWFQSWMGTFRAFWNQPTRSASISLSLLYLTVLSLGLLMTAYIKAQGLTEAELAVDRGFGAVTGILATFSFPLMRSGLGKIPPAL